MTGYYRAICKNSLFRRMQWELITRYVISKKFTKSQQHYSTIEKEALALLLALQQFEMYLDTCNGPVLVCTDHNPLVFLFRMSNSNQRLMRRSLLIQGFNLEIRHKKGCENVLADALSRAPCQSEN